MYIRIKKLKKQKYAYLVKNKRDKRKKWPKQITVKYLGRVYSPKVSKIKKFEKSDIYFNKKKSKEIIQDLIEFELKKYGFKKSEGAWKQKCILINLSSMKVSNEKNKDISVELNEGFLNEYNLKKLFSHKNNLKIPELEQGKTLANLLVSCGLMVDEFTFLRLFDKIHKS